MKLHHYTSWAKCLSFDSFQIILLYILLHGQDCGPAAKCTQISGFFFFGRCTVRKIFSTWIHTSSTCCLCSGDFMCSTNLRGVLKCRSQTVQNGLEETFAICDQHGNLSSRASQKWSILCSFHVRSYLVLLGSSVFDKITSKVRLADCTPALQASVTHHTNTITTGSNVHPANLYEYYRSNLSSLISE